MLMIVLEGGIPHPIEADSMLKHFDGPSVIASEACGGL